ncbi:hypothetical protein [Cloacibacillus evryensis]|uniref:hypothetical protein n=1 Tax=Cloacibacillus evryensis TaxID=508460 RepID=UPI00370DBEC6
MSNSTKDSENILTVDELKKYLEQRRRLPSRRRLTQLREIGATRSRSSFSSVRNTSGSCLRKSARSEPA